MINQKSVRQLFTPLLFFLFFIGFSHLQFAQDTTVILGSGNYSNMVITTSNSSGSSSGVSTVDGMGLLPNLESASRFLGQATLGANYNTVLATADKSYNQWLEEQFQMPSPFTVEGLTEEIIIMAVDSTFTYGGDPNEIDSDIAHWQSAWWKYTLESPNVLRNRIAFALSEIFVVSEVPQLEEVPLALANYYDMLLDNSFANFRDLLDDVTEHPCMGLYLTHINNPKSDSTLFRFPDENYAREVMQLFSIGLFELNIDGTQILDGNNQAIPTYNNETIQEFSKIFTGFSYGDAFVFGQDATSESSFLIPMMMHDAWHESGEKNLLNGFTVPDRNPVDGLADVSDALDNIFNHQNVGPFIAYKLIQRLVKSNPSPEYIARAASAFNDNGQGVRGDMKAFVRAILLDPEARDCAGISDPLSGMLREPMLRYAQVARGFNAYSDSEIYRSRMRDFYFATSQKPLASPSVFNFFQQDYQPLGPIEQAGLFAPEFQITNTVTISGYANMLHEWIFDERPMEYFGLFNQEDWGTNYDANHVKLDLSVEYALGDDEHLNELIERINLVFLHGQMSEETRNTIYNATTQLPQEDEDDLEIRAKLVIFLALMSPDYLIIK